MKKDAKRLFKKEFACAEYALSESAVFIKKVEELHYPIEAHLEERVERKLAIRNSIFNK